MKRTFQAIVVGMLLAVPGFAQEQPKPDPTTAAPAQVVTQAPAPTTPVKDPNDWKRPLKEIKFREF